MSPRSPPLRRRKLTNSRTERGSTVVQFSHFSVKELLAPNRLANLSHIANDASEIWGKSAGQLVHDPPTAASAVN